MTGMRRYFIEQSYQKANFKKFWLIWYSEDSLAKVSKENSLRQLVKAHLLAVVRQGAFFWTVWPRCPRRILSKSLAKVHLCTVVCQGAFVQDSLAKVSKENSLRQFGQGSLMCCSLTKAF
jgi:hypothetical protein